MPLYEYISPGGHTALEHRPVDDRDKPLVIEGVRFSRVRVPKSVTTCCGAQPETMSQKAFKGYAKLEGEGKLKDRPGYLPAATVKRALLAPEID